MDPSNIIVPLVSALMETRAKANVRTFNLSLYKSYSQWVFRAMK